MAAGRRNLVIERGATFDPIFVWKVKDANGVETVKDLTGYTAEAHFRRSYDDPTPFLSTGTSDNTILLGGVEGTIQFNVTDTVTRDIDADVTGGVWDLELKAPGASGKKTRLLKGKVKVDPEVTHD